MVMTAAEKCKQGKHSSNLFYYYSSVSGGIENDAHVHIRWKSENSEKKSHFALHRLGIPTVELLMVMGNNDGW